MLAAVSISKLTPVAKLIISFFSCLLTVRFGSYFDCAKKKKNVNKPSALLT